MTVKIVIKKIEDLKHFRLRATTLKLQLWQFQAKTLKDLADAVLLVTIHKKMREADPPFSEKIVINTIVSGVKLIGKRKIRIFFKSELFTETGFDIALVREKTGTVDHWVPKVHPIPGKHALRFVDEGIVKFSKGHEVSGIQALHIIKNTLDELAPAVQLQYESKLQYWISQNLKGEAISV